MVYELYIPKVSQINRVIYIYMTPLKVKPFKRYGSMNKAKSEDVLCISKTSLLVYVIGITLNKFTLYLVIVSLTLIEML